MQVHMPTTTTKKILGIKIDWINKLLIEKDR